MQSNPAPESLADIVIPVYYHVVYANQTFDGGYLSNQNVQDAFNLLVTGFQNTGFTFQLEEVRRHFNPTWFNEVGISDPWPIEWDMKHSTRVGGPRTLNIWSILISHISLRKISNDGYAQFPWNYATNPDSDGVTMKYTVFPGNGHPTRSGKTLIHEAGHWLGLYHTFEGNSCFGNNDFVDDTPAQAFPTDGCPFGLDTCPQPGADPISNYMNYSFDSCLTEFTPGQINRMLNQYQQFRA
ncbi:hypothetical protein FA15DRAFT_592727 [Coprinopsis marcescibilis]|uniref:Peptidase M43 pregnancy-associated plasma-A domain-containing protein n=1 Tax=Coprinopsis marcescibilis TaxID=230819 RepID=A0A5C3KVC0_COPMA|nr:hypothetical protein FA15DRAFT_592727 [Coprinopsis marcescibilis]